jgi:hypothetical protein
MAAGLLARARDGASRMVNQVSKAVGLTATDGMLCCISCLSISYWSS